MIMSKTVHSVRALSHVKSPLVSQKSVSRACKSRASVGDRESENIDRRMLMLSIAAGLSVAGGNVSPAIAQGASNLYLGSG
jgi:hypothetical protein